MLLPFPYADYFLSVSIVSLFYLTRFFCFESYTFPNLCDHVSAAAKFGTGFIF